MSQEASAVLRGLRLEREEYVGLLSKLIGYSEQLQNHPPALVPKEDLPATAVTDFLANHTDVLEITKHTYIDGRSNLILKYPGTHPTAVVSFVGSHLDVVPANPDLWDFNPFELSTDPENEDILRGRGVTDCLGHVALISCLFKALAVNKPALKASVVAVFIASEENTSIPDVGIDMLMKNGHMDFLKHGPLLWVDSANFGPTLGTAGVLGWKLEVAGKAFHSGLPHMAINSIDAAYQVSHYIQTRFHQDFAMGDSEKEYMFAIGSSMKSTSIWVPEGGLNQIPGVCVIKGDIRITPFHSIKDIKAAIARYIEEIDMNSLPTSGYGTYELVEEGLKPKISFEWLGDECAGIACSLESVGHRSLRTAVAEIHGRSREFSITGSLPLVADLKEAGYDVQVTGFGRMEAYHAKNEFALFSEFAQGFQILARVIEATNEEA